MNERKLIQRINEADASEFAQILCNVSLEEAQALKVYFGEEGFERLRHLALDRTTRGTNTKGNVVVLHGILGGELTFYKAGFDAARIWLSIPRIILGQFLELKLDSGGLFPARLLSLCGTTQVEY